MMKAFDDEVTSTELPASVQRVLRDGLPFTSALEASNAAAAASRRLPPPLPPPRRPLRVVPREVTPDAGRDSGPPSKHAILWFDPAVVSSLRAAPALASAFPAPAGKRKRVDPREEPAPERVPHDLRSVMLGSPCPSRHLGTLLDDAARDGSLAAPLALVEGTLLVRFDDRQALEATVAIAQATYPASQAVRDANEVAQTILSNAWATVETLATGRQMVRAAIARAHPTDTFDAVVDRALLERRAFRRRRRLGAEHLAFEATVDDETLPIDLPQPLAGILPLYPCLPVRALVEAHPAQDANDPRRILLVRALVRTFPAAVAPASPAVR